MAEVSGFASVNVLEIRSLPLTERTDVYCLLSVDRQVIRTSAVTIAVGGIAEWCEGYTFDITSSNTPFSIVVWGVSSSCQSGKILGQLVLPSSAVFQELEGAEKVVNLTDQNGKATPAEMRYKLQYSSPKNKRRVGFDDFQMLKFLGKGSFGKVMLAKKKDTNRLYAMKVMRKDKLFREAATALPLTERDVLKKYNHPYVVHLKYAFQNETHLYMVMDYLSGGDLFDLMVSRGTFDEDTTRFYVAQVVLAITFLHEHDIIYRDLKPENLLLDMQGNMCLVDFGLCKEGMLNDQITHTFCGSLQYMAPEVLKGEGYGKSVDWWALGVIIYEMLTGVHPFLQSSNPASFTEKEIIHGIIHENVQFSSRLGCMSKSAIKLLSNLLQKDPRRRMGSGPKANDDIKNHPFFDGINWKKLAKKELLPPYKPHLNDLNLEKRKDPWAGSEHYSGSPTFEILNDAEQECFQSFSYTCPAELSRSRSSPAFRFLRQSTSPRNSPVSPRFTGRISNSPNSLRESLSPRGCMMVRSSGFTSLAAVDEAEEEELADLIDEELNELEDGQEQSSPAIRRQRRRWSLSNFHVDKKVGSGEEKDENNYNSGNNSSENSGDESGGGSGVKDGNMSNGDGKLKKSKGKSFLKGLFGKK